MGFSSDAEALGSERAEVLGFSARVYLLMGELADIVSRTGALALWFAFSVPSWTFVLLIGPMCYFIDGDIEVLKFVATSCLPTALVGALGGRFILGENGNLLWSLLFGPLTMLTFATGVFCYFFFLA